MSSAEIKAKIRDSELQGTLMIDRCFVIYLNFSIETKTQPQKSSTDSRPIYETNMSFSISHDMTDGYISAWMLVGK